MKKAATVLFFLLFTTSVMAQDIPASNANRGVPARVVGDEKPYRIVYDHAIESITIFDASGKEIETWENQSVFSPIAPLLDVPPDRPIQFEIQNANALLYGYDVSHVTARQQDVRSCKELGRLFTGNILTSFIPSAESVLNFELPTGLNSGALATSLEEMLASIPKGALEMEERGDAEYTGAQIADLLSDIRLEGTVSRFAAKARKLVEVVGGIDDAMLSVALRAEEEPIVPLIDELLAEIRSGIGTEPSQDAETIALAKTIRLSRAEVLPAVTRLKEADKAISEGRFRSDDSFADVSVSLKRMLMEIEELDDEMQDAFSDLNAYIFRLKKTKALAHQYFAIPASPNFRRITIELSSENGITEETESLPRFKEGDVAFYTQARSTVDCQISLGVTVMNPLPDFDIGPDGLLIDRKAGNTDPRTTASLLFHLASPRFPLFGLSAGLGVGEGTSRPDLYAAGTIRFLNPVLINVGAVWRYSPRLPDGFSLGDLVGDDTIYDQVVSGDLGRRYIPSLFVGIGFAMR